jgi:hypothetical protein
VTKPKAGDVTREWPNRFFTAVAIAANGVTPKPTPGLEPGTPSLRVKCSTS